MNLPAMLGGPPTFNELIPVARPLLPNIREIEAEFAEILTSRILSKGRHCTTLESSVTAALDVKHAIAVSSCTTGLMLTYQALDLTGEVIVPSFTFMSTVGALRWAGLRPVFADVDPTTTNVNPKTVRAAITRHTSAIVAVHNFGNPCDIDQLQSLADDYGLRLVFDAAHCFGSLYNGRPLGAQGDAQVFSLSPTKLVVAGEGGIVTTNNDQVAARVRVGREFGNCGNYDSVRPGLNGRLPEINALLAKHSLNNLEVAVEVRNRMAAMYRERIGKLPGIKFQEVRSTDRSCYKDFAIVIDPDSFGLTRHELALTLRAENIETRAYYDPSTHQQRAYSQFTPANGLPHTEMLAANILCLPIWSAMDAEICLKISDAIALAHRFACSIHSKLKNELNPAVRTNANRKLGRAAWPR